MTANAGWVNVGTDHDTAGFAVESIRRWWNTAGSSEYPRARRLLITADAGGLQRLPHPRVEAGAGRPGGGDRASDHGLPLPARDAPGTSKWNKVEHRLFSHITMNWRGRPLTSHDVVINSIAATTTRTGLTVQARLDDGTYPTGVKVTSAQMAALPVSRHPFHGDWNYTLHPAARAPAGNDQERSPAALPELTGMTPAGLDELIARLTALRQAQREEKARNHPASDARHKPRSGRPPAFPFPDLVVAAVLHLRLALPDGTLAHLLGTSRTTIRRALTEIQDLLDQHGHRIEPVTARQACPRGSRHMPLRPA